MSDYLIFKYVLDINIKKIELLLKKNRNLLNIRGPDGNLPIHAACLKLNKKIIDFFLSYDKNLLNEVNSNKVNGYQILAALDINLLIYYLKELPPNNIHHQDSSGRTLLITYLLFNKYDNLNDVKKLKEYGCSLIYPKDINSVYFLLEKCDLLLDLSKIFEMNVNNLHFNTPISFSTLYRNDLKCLKNLVNIGIDLNLESETDNIVSLSIKERKINFLEYLVEKNIDFNFIDSFEYTYFHLLLFDDFYDNHINLVSKFADKVNLNHQDILGDTCMHILFSSNKYQMYKDIILKKKVNLNILNKDGKKPLDFLEKSKRKKILNELKDNLIKESAKDDLKIVKSKRPVFTTFRGFFHTVLSSIHYLLNKHDNLGYPLCEKTNLKDVNKSGYLSEMLKHEFNEETVCLSCGRIWFKDENNYHLSDNFTNCLRNVISKDIIIFYLVIQLDNSSTHANVIIIDNRNNTIERFEPMGSHFAKNYNDIMLDEILSKILIKAIKEINNESYKYNTPLDFQNIYDFQSIAKEDLFFYEGETLGFCVAWVIWYIDHKLMNPKVESQKLIYKLKNKLKSQQIEIIDHIRGYADILQKYKLDLFLKFKLPKNKLYRIQADKDLRLNFYKNLIEDFKKIQK